MSREGPVAKVDKPPFRLSTLEELRARPRNGLIAASTFSGCGGSSTGLLAAGYKVGAAVEFITHAQEVYGLNHPDTHLFRRDVRSISGDEILEQLGIDVGQLDLFDGSPPCEPFSTAGVREQNWGKVSTYSEEREQRSDDLFFEFARLVDQLRPRAFIAENVVGLIVGKAKGYFKIIYRALTDLGYRVEARVLDAQWLGVPQRRRRVIFVGVRGDLGIDPPFPEPLPYRYAASEAVPSLKRLRQINVYGKGDSFDDLRNHVIPTITGQGISAKAKDQLEIERLDGTARQITIPELAALSGFPPDYRWTGSFAKQWERIGDCVPPPMAEATGRAIANVLA